MELEKNMLFMNDGQKEEYKKCIGTYEEKYSDKLDFDLFEIFIRKFIEMNGKYNDIDFNFINNRINSFTKENYEEETNLIFDISEAYYYKLYGQDAYAKFLGTIHLGEEVMVSDPCYDPDTWCTEVLENVKPGEYDCYAIVTTDLDHHIVSALSVVPKGEEPKVASMVKSNADIGVDSGTCGIYDFEYFYYYHHDKKSKDSNFEEWYNNFACGMINKKKGDDYYNITDKQGVITQTAYGDGGYTLFTDNDENGKTVVMTIVYSSPSFWDPVHKILEEYKFNIIGKVNASDNIDFNIGNYGNYKRLTMIIDKYGKEESVKDFTKNYFNCYEPNLEKDKSNALRNLDLFNFVFDLTKPSKIVKLEHPIKTKDERSVSKEEYYVIGLAYIESPYFGGYRKITVDSLDHYDSELGVFVKTEDIHWFGKEFIDKAINEVKYLLM